MSKSQRKSYLIHKKLQVKYILLTFIFLLAHTVLFVCLMLAPYIYSLIVDIPLEEQAQAARMLLNLHNTIWPILGVVIVVMSFATIYITHRIAGPMHRLKAALSEVSGGNLAINLTLRKNDDLKELAEDINVLISDLRNLVEAMNNNRTALTECVGIIDEKVGNGAISREDGERLLKALNGCIENSSLRLDKYLSAED